MSEAVDKYWNTFGHLDLDSGEMLDETDVRSCEIFTDEEILELIAEGLVCGTDCSDQ